MVGSGIAEQTQPSYQSSAPLPYPSQMYGPFPADQYQTAVPYSQEATPQGSQTQAQPPSPGRKSIFDFVSPFDALSSTTTSTGKKKAEPVSLSMAESRDTDDSWTSATADPKRKSMENLMDQLTRSQGPVIPTQQQFDGYGSEPATPPNEPVQFQSKAQPSYTVKPAQLPPSPPRTYTQHILPQSGDLSSISHGPSGLGGRARAGSPSIRGNGKNGQEGRVRMPKIKPIISPS